MSTAVAVGVFDGLHVGHRALFAHALARAAGARCVAVSFDPHPDVVLAREFRSLPPLTPIPEKQERLAALGIELHVLPFTRELAAMTPETFVAEHLRAPFAPRWLVVGEDFALGRGRAGNVPRLREIGASNGFDVDAVPLETVAGAPVTSTRIRECLAAGDVALAARLLGRPYGLSGQVVHGDHLGRELGCPTANLRLYEERQLPRDGVYAVRARVGDEGRVWPAALSLGTRPTVGGGSRVLEVHLIGFEGDLYGRRLEIAWVDWLRPQAQFESLDTLRRAIGDDVVLARDRLSSAAQEPWPASPRNA